MIIKPRRHTFTNEPYFYNIQTKDMYRRVVGGVGWPGDNRPGFAVVVSEHLYKDGKYSIRRLNVLREIETPMPEELLHDMGMLQGIMMKVDWYADTKNPCMEYLAKQNRELFFRKEPKLTLKKPPRFDPPKVFGLYGQLIKKRIGKEKTLYINKCERLRTHMLSIEDMHNFREEQSPAYSALMYAVAALDMRAFRPEAMPRQRIADRTGGY